jgi:hypothetical protein
MSETIIIRSGVGTAPRRASTAPVATTSIGYETRTMTCPDCGKDFEYDYAEIKGKPILLPARCWDCVERYRGQQRVYKDELNKRKVEATWRDWLRKTCPSILDNEKYLMNCDKRLRDAATAWTTTLPAERGLGLVGPTGCGKTVCSILALREAHRIGGTVAFVDATTLAEAANLSRWGQREEKLIARQDIEGWKSAQYLLLDDIGQAAANGNEDADALLFDLVKLRCEQSRPILWTCQGGDAWLKDRLGPIRYPAITRRLIQTCDVTSLFTTTTEPQQDFIV